MKKPNLLTLSHDYQMDKSQVLGKGSTGEVYLGKQISTGLPVAIKLIRLETIDNQVTDYLLRMEKIALTALNHENVLRGMKIIENSSKCYMVTEFCNGGTLKQLIKKQGSLNEQKSIQILKGILRGYSSLARRKIVHRDLKPANIMLHNSVPKIIDFGYCEIEGYQKPSLEYNVGSPSYMSPESFESNIYNEKTEIWAIGIILYECLMGKTFDDGKHMSEVFKTIKKFGIPFSRQVSDKSRQIVNWCLEFLPDKRPSALQLLSFISEKKANEPQFFILDKNRKKAASLYTNANGFESSNLLTKKKAPVVQKKILTPLMPQQKTVEMQMQTETLRRKISIKDYSSVIVEERERRTSRSNSKHKEKFGAIVQNHQALRKTQNIPLQTRERISSNYLVKNEYGLNREPVFKTEKYFTGQNIQNKIPMHHISAFNSGMTSPREMEKKESINTYFANVGQRNPESGKLRINSKTSSGVPNPAMEAYFDSNPSMAYRHSVNMPERLQKQVKLTIRKQNPQCGYIQKDPVTLTTRHSSHYYQAKPALVKQSTQLPSYQVGFGNLNRDRPSSSIYQLNKVLDERDKPISIFRSGVQMGQKTYR